MWYISNTFRSQNGCHNSKRGPSRVTKSSQHIMDLWGRATSLTICTNPFNLRSCCWFCIKLYKLTLCVSTYLKLDGGREGVILNLDVIRERGEGPRPQCQEGGDHPQPREKGGRPQSREGGGKGCWLVVGWGDWWSVQRKKNRLQCKQAFMS